MASRYTYEQFRQAAQNSGLLGQFSQADLELAQRSPDAGMSILTEKQNFANAATDEERAQANRRAEAIRASYGNYTGGKDGSGFTLTPLSPGSFTYADAPTYTGSDYTDAVRDLWEQQNNYGDFSYGPAPEYNNRYDETIQGLIGEILNREDFSYNPAADPLYQNYRKQYTREGDRAAADALGAAAAASGGIPSSYASTAAAQAANYYAAQMTDKIPELYELAYNKYLNDYNMQLSDLGVVQGAEQSDYDKYLNELAQYNTDRNFDYNAWMDRYNILSNNLQTALGLDQDQYNRYLNELAQYNTDRNFAYGQLLDEIDSQELERQNALQEAIYQAQIANDYSGLADRGWDVSSNPYSTSLGQAQVDAILSAGGTPSDALLAQSGYSGEYAQAMQNAYQRELEAQASRVSGGAYSPSGTPAASALSDADIQSIISYYGGKTLTPTQWEELLQSNPGLTEEDLLTAGFTLSGNSTPDQRVSTYQQAAAALSQAGRSSSGLMTSSEWARHKNQGSRDQSGAADFATYEDYLQAYIDYMLGQ